MAAHRRIIRLRRHGAIEPNQSPVRSLDNNDGRLVGGDPHQHFGHIPHDRSAVGGHGQDKADP
jgi:hypothetical protein